MHNNTTKRRTAGWITAAVAASVAFGLAGVAASAVTVENIATAFSQAAAQSAAERAGYGASGGAGTGSGSTGSSGTSGATGSSQTATANEQKGVVVIDTDLAYQGAEAAGTGIVLTSSGEILTNNHVVEGSTSITVTIPSTGASYKASVVGTDAADDIAVLELSGASGLATATLDTGSVNVGDNVTAVGNAGGTGSLVAADGQITGTGKSITTAAEGAVSSETLTGLIETNAGIQAGDSGGPLLDSQGEVVGIDTAASSDQSVSDGYAIPVQAALAVVKQIESGQATANVRIGLPAFLGVEVASSDSSVGGASGYPGSLNGNGYSNGTQTQVQGAQVGAVLNGTPAASAGIVAGSTITAVNGTAVSSSADLTSVLANYKPGDSVAVTWTDASGASHSATVTLTSGPAA
ncbi:S1C family serine protease [Rathayibacter sp. KR2-224]|uniref:S1C family serine protease n=1 Tax=Rathayibacter sp. KR2-224 TaxID=3400913 RepID=UPI003C01B56C